MLESSKDGAFCHDLNVSDAVSFRMSLCTHSLKHSPSKLLCLQGVSRCAQEYEQFYVPEMEARRREKEAQEARRKKVRKNCGRILV